MAYIVPGVDDFRARFPAFDPVTYPDDLVQLVLDEASLQVDDTWTDTSAPIAILYLTAHILGIERMQSTGGVGAIGGGGFLRGESVGPFAMSTKTLRSSSP